MALKEVWGLFVEYLVRTLFSHSFLSLFWASLSKLSRIVHITSHSNNTAINVTNDKKQIFAGVNLP